MSYGPNEWPVRVLQHGRSRGPDVGYAVRAANRRLDARGLDHYISPGHRDADYLSIDDLEAIAKAAWALGAMPDTVRRMRDRREVPIGVQALVRFPSRRSEAQLARARGIADDIARAASNQGTKPRIITAAQLGLTFQYVWGYKGNPYRGAGHYTAGHMARDAAALRTEMLNEHAYHKGKGWGGLSYEAMVANDGTLGLGNPVNRMSAAVAVNNSGMVGICVPGTTGDRIPEGAKDTIAWLLDNWHTTAIPAAHRLPRSAKSLSWRGHKEYPSQSTACPGDMLNDYKRLFANA